MNPAGQPGQPNPGPGQANMPPRPGAQAVPGQQQQRRRAYKPEDMDELPLADADKQRYTNGLQNLWNITRNNTPGSQQHQEALKKIYEFSAQLFNKLRMMGVTRPPTQIVPTGGPGLQGAQGQPGQANNQAGGDQNAAASAGSPPAQAQGQGQPAAPAMAAGPSSQGQAQQPGARQLQMSAQVRQHVESFGFVAPQNVVDQGPEAAAQWIKGKKEQYGRYLMQLSSLAHKMIETDNAIKQLQGKGPAMTQDDHKKLQDVMGQKTRLTNAHGQCKGLVDTFRKEQLALKEARSQANGGGQDATGNQPVRPGPSPQQPSTSDAARAQQSGAPGANGGQQQQQAPATGPQQQQPPPATAPQSQTPSQTAAPQSGNTQQQQQKQIKTEPGQVPPPVNTAIASAGHAGLPSASTPTQTARVSTPQTQIQTPTTGAPRSLSHTAALQIANQNRNSQPGLPQTSQQGTPGLAGTPSSAGVIGSIQQQGHPHAHPTQQAPTLTPKLPIPKHLHDKAAQPPQAAPTNIGGVTPGRPTYTQGGGTPGGVMGQSVLPKIPVVQMEGEGERVLNRKKLDDLVRQVCGGQAEGQESNALTPDVEEVSQFDFPSPFVFYLKLRNLHRSAGKKVAAQFLDETRS